MVKVLVTGGAGFIGSNFIRYALKKHADWHLTTLDKLTYAGRIENLHGVMDDPRHTFVQGDIADAAVSGPLVEASNIVVHFAAETHVDRSILAAGDFIRTDVEGTFVLLEAARRAKGLQRFVQISTDEVYGSVSIGASKENAELKPRNPYSASKAGADRLAYSYWATYNLPVIITRASNNYGPYQFPEKIIPLFVTNAIDNIPLPLYGDGRQIRDWLHVDDHCRGLDLLLERGNNGEVYNIGGGNEIMNVNLTQRILTELGKPKTLIKQVEDRPGHDRRYSLDTTKLRSLGWEPATAFDAGLRATVDWYRRNETWWRPVKEKDPAFRAYHDAQYQVSADGVAGAVLVTGAGGFAGSHLVHHLVASGFRRKRDLAGWTRADVDLLDRHRVRAAIAELRPSQVYHLAGAAHVAESWTDTAGTLAANVLATHHLFDALRRAGLACRVVVPGSAHVYAPSARPMSEEAPLAPASPYAISKLAQEQLSLRALTEDGIEPILTRSFNHTGPRQSPTFAASSMARQIALIERGEAEPVIKVGNLDSRRDLTDVRDTVRAYALLMEGGTPGTIYNVASGTAHSTRAVLDTLLALARVPIRVETDPARLRPNDIPILIGDPTRLRETTGWTPEISLDRMIGDLLDYWRGV